MGYRRTVGEDHPGLFVFVIDCSGSMGYNWPGSSASAAIKKAQFAADVLNKTIREIGANAVGRERIKHRCDISVIGYDGTEGTTSMWGGTLANKWAVGIPEIVANPLGTLTRKEQRMDPVDGVVEVDRKYDYWIQATVGGSTPMGSALAKAREITEEWLANEHHRDSFPPVVIHITDGVPDRDERTLALTEAEALKALETSDGNVLLLTVHIPDKTFQTVLFPVEEDELPKADRDSAKLLFEMSSILPPELLESARNAGLEVRPESRLLVINADALAASKLITWGSSSGGARGSDEPGMMPGAAAPAAPIEVPVAVEPAEAVEAFA